MANQSVVKPQFMVTRRGSRPNKSVTLNINLAAQSAGAAFMEDASAPNGQDASELVTLATGAKPFAGFVTRDVLAATGGVPTVPMPTYSELSEGMSPSLPLETQFSAGTEGSVEDAEEYEAESSVFLSSANGGGRDFTGATPIGTRCSFYNGVTCIAVTGQVAEYYLAEWETPQTTGNLRGRFVRIYGNQL
jgi:hypothetical protein